MQSMCPSRQSSPILTVATINLSKDDVPHFPRLPSAAAANYFKPNQSNVKHTRDEAHM
jgi:hypothetical protein